ncbi:putative GPI-anchored protein pfl2 [Neltuma alba]|uniref:putative GPI-anchored protein pfl2 n=1 Tax=Neltuma alba TaxID=207710 RepID=UPI0010A51992|nr:putative GPI-anchored protein pfl2 [Prosopis alba]
MPSKLRKAIGAVKDQTSLSLAKVTNAANLDVVILKATTHDEIPIEGRYVNEIVSLVSSNKVYAAACAQSIGKRIGKTRNWVVALKSLMIILRIFQDGDPYFPREILHAMRRGSRILNLSGFRDDSSSSPWEFTAFVRLMALYLDERLDCFLTGKLQRRITFKNHQNPFKNHKDTAGIIKDMKPSMLLDKITFWQRLLDRAVGTRPTGEAKTNRLVQISLYAVVQETFDLYRDISDGLSVILDSFFKLPYKACVSAFQACVKSCKQFDELSDFYSFCLSIGVGRSSEYPKVQKISEELLETLQEFLRDQATSSTNINLSNHNHHRAQSSSSSSQYSPLSKHLFVSALRESSSVHFEGYERYGTPESSFETASENASSHCTSLEDLMIATDVGILTPRRFEIDYGDDQEDEKQSEKNDDSSSAYESCSNHSYTNDQTVGSSLDLVSLDEVQNDGEKEKRENNIVSSNNDNTNNNASQDCWELVLAETATSSTTEKAPADYNNAIVSLFDQSDLIVPHQQYNPFLEFDDTTVSPFTNAIDQTQTSLIDISDGNQTVMVSTFTGESSSFDVDLTSTFGDLNSNTSCAMPTSSSLEDLTENSMALVPSSQENNHGMNSTSIFHSQGSFKISPNSTSGSKTSIFPSQGSFMTNSALASQSNELYQTSMAPTFNSQDLFKISSISSFQGDHDAYQMITRPTFNSQNSFKFSSTSTSQSHDDSYQTRTAPTFSSQSSFKLSSTLSPYQGHDSYYQTSTAPTFSSQNSFNNSVTSSFDGHHSYQTNTIPTFNSQNSFKFGSTSTTSQGHDDSYQPSTRPTFTSQSSFKLSPTSTSQGHNSSQMSIVPAFNSQNSFKNGSTSSFQGHDSYWTSTTPTLSSSNSFKINSASSTPSHESYHLSIAPTFYGHNSYQTSLESPFQGHNSYMMGTTSTSVGINSYQICNEQPFQRHTSHQASIEPTLHTQFPNQVSIEPIFHGHSSSQTNSESAFHAYNSYLTSTMPSSYSNDSWQMSKEPIFETHNSYQTNTIPNFQTHNTYQTTSTTPSPTFRIQNNNLSMVEATPTIVARNPNNEDMIQSTSWEQNFLDTRVEPTFRVKVSNEPLLGAPKEDDPFGSLWPSSSLTNNEDALEKSMQKLSLERQKQIWTEQQKRIIEKHLN